MVDVGIHRTRGGLVGDVRFEEVRAVAGHLTPVPGGVGPMTIAVLLAHTVDAAERGAAALHPQDPVDTEVVEAAGAADPVD